jgi:hypothetical protein
MKQTAQEKDTVPQKVDYYTNSVKRKVVDFLIGFFGIIAFNVLFFWSILSMQVFGTIFSIYLSIIVIVIVLELVGIYFLILYRRYIGIGVLCSLLVLPLLLFGACIVMLSNFM